MKSSEATEQTNVTLSDTSEMKGSLEDINPNENISKGLENAILSKQGFQHPKKRNIRKYRVSIFLIKAQNKKNRDLVSLSIIFHCRNLETLNQ